MILWTNVLVDVGGKKLRVDRLVGWLVESLSVVVVQVILWTNVLVDVG